MVPGIRNDRVVNEVIVGILHIQNNIGDKKERIRQIDTTPNKGRLGFMLVIEEEGCIVQSRQTVKRKRSSRTDTSQEAFEPKPNQINRKKTKGTATTTTRQRHNKYPYK